MGKGKESGCACCGVGEGKHSNTICVLAPISALAFGVVFIMSWLMLLNYWTVFTPDGSTSSTSYGATKMCQEEKGYGSLNDVCYDFKYSSCEYTASGIYSGYKSASVEDDACAAMGGTQVASAILLVLSGVCLVLRLCICCVGSCGCCTHMVLAVMSASGAFVNLILCSAAAGSWNSFDWEGELNPIVNKEPGKHDVAMGAGAIGGYISIVMCLISLALEITIAALAASDPESNKGPPPKEGGFGGGGGGGPNYAV